MKIRQIALVAGDLATVQGQLFALLGIEEAYVDEAVAEFGLRNIVTTIGNTFLEVVSPIQENTTAGRLLQRRGGDGGYMVIVQVDDAAAEKARLAEADIRLVWEVDTGNAKALHLHPRDVPGALPSLDEMVPPEAWYWAGPDWEKRAAKLATAITAAQLQVKDPVAAAERWSLAYATPFEIRNGQPVLALEDTEVRFVPIEDGRGEGLQAIDLCTPDVSAVLDNARKLGLLVEGNSVMICGTRLCFHPSLDNEQRDIWNPMQNTLLHSQEKPCSQPGRD
jgi:Glyoxalase-like domain